MLTAVIGSQGQLGRDLCPRLPGQVVALTRAEADLTNASLLRKTLGDLHPDVVVNCAAYNFVDQAESEPEACFAVNGWGSRHLAQVCHDLDCTLVHFSTDYVFGLDSLRSVPFSEVDAPGPVSVYGTSKLTGEYTIRAHCPKHFVIRTCGLYGVWGSGGKGTNFVETMLRIAGEGKPLKVVDDQRCTPTYTADLAAAVWPLVETGRYGLYHLTNTGDCSWFEFAREIFRQAGVAADLAPVPSTQYPRPARRPPYSVLTSPRLAALGLPALRPWPEALAAYLAERRQRAGTAG
jgi:dTDP-4-dehydrorhamnose reductase